MRGQGLVRLAFAICAAGCREHEAAPGAPPPPEPARADDAPPPPAAPPSALALPELATDWCRPPWRGVAEGTCYLAGGGERDLLVYLPGIYPPSPTSPQKDNVERVVLAASRRAGVAALLPRGRRGIGPANAKDWWAWPTAPSSHAMYGRELVAEWAAAREKLEGALGRKFEHVYLAGSSSGAYFLTALVLAAEVAADGYAATSGGAVARVGSPTKRPFYVGYGAGDPTNGGPRALGAFLERSGWPVRVAEHPGGHGAREIYLDEALAFWRAK